MRKRPEGRGGRKWRFCDDLDVTKGGKQKEGGVGAVFDERQLTMFALMRVVGRAQMAQLAIAHAQMMPSHDFATYELLS
jgi:hypothetical protein